MPAGMKVKVRMADGTPCLNANENADRQQLTAAVLALALKKPVSWLNYQPSATSKPIHVTLMTVDGAASSSVISSLVEQVLLCEEPVFVVLNPWRDAAANAFIGAGAADCLDGSSAPVSLAYKIAKHCDAAVAVPGGLRQLRWSYEFENQTLLLSPSLMAFFQGDDVSTSLSLERFLITLAGLSAQSILQAVEDSVVLTAPKRLVHSLSHPGLADHFGGFAAHEITAPEQGDGSAPRVCGVLLADVSAKEHSAASASRSALPEAEFTRVLHRFLGAQQKRIGLSSAVCVLSIDRFEQMNVLLGRQLGDDLLEHVAERIKSVIKAFEDARDSKDVRAIALGRLGGAQFAVAMEGAVMIKEASSLAMKILSSFQAPFTIADQRLYLDARIGISVAAMTERNADKILSRANVALYQAFKDPAGSYRVFNASHAAEAQERVILDAELRDALSQDNLFMRYMPLVDLNTGEVVGVEALVRWNHPEMGLLSPELFIPMAEESGVIADVGDWVLSNALREFAQVAPALPDTFHLSVNVSAEQFRRGDLEQTVINQLYAAGLDERRLTLEITETLLIEDFDRARTIMAALQSRGIRWSIDDFGTGFSALSYLSQLPFDEVKLDRSFVAALTKDSVKGSPSTVVDAVVSIARSHNASIVAEGIETAHQAELLKARGCDLGQGYCFSEPLPIGDLAAFVERAGRP